MHQGTCRSGRRADSGGETPAGLMAVIRHGSVQHHTTSIDSATEGHRMVLCPHSFFRWLQKGRVPAAPTLGADSTGALLRLCRAYLLHTHTRTTQGQKKPEGKKRRKPRPRLSPSACRRPPRGDGVRGA